MAEGKKTVLLYCDLIHTIEKLSDEQAGKLFLENLDNKYKEFITDSKAYNFKGKKGYLISYTETVKKETIFTLTRIEIETFL